ncbi:MAG: FGGY family carbohydrate kinase [Mycobacterium sp.]|nr:FGGY family carbohydrate kinase [Mycobacterium sp.]
MFIGIPHAPVPLGKETFNQFMRQEATLHGSWNSFSAPFPGDEVADVGHDDGLGQLEWEFMITHELGLSGLRKAMQQLGERSIFSSKVLPAYRTRTEMGILLSIDLGTEGARVGAFTEDGHALGTAHRPYPTRFPRPGWAEQDPREWWAAITAATRELLSSEQCRRAGEVSSIAAATTASTVAVLDAAGEPLRKPPGWTAAAAPGVRAHRAAVIGVPDLEWRSGSVAAGGWCPRPCGSGRTTRRTTTARHTSEEAVD